MKLPPSVFCNEKNIVVSMQILFETNSIYFYIETFLYRF